jgi:hypothetical protein
MNKFSALPVSALMAFSSFGASHLGSSSGVQAQRGSIASGRGFPSFVTVCGVNLCLNGSRFYVKGATGYGQYASPSAEMRRARAGRLTTLELVEFGNIYHTLGDLESSATWDTGDEYIAAAERAGLHVILNLAELGQALAAAGYNFTSGPSGNSFPDLGWQSDWDQYLSFIANRRNSVTAAIPRHLGCRQEGVTQCRLEARDHWRKISSGGRPNEPGRSRTRSSAVVHGPSGQKAGPGRRDLQIPGDRPANSSR